MLQYQVNPQVGSLEVLYYIFYYLKIDMKMVRIGYDLIDPNIDLSVFNNNVYWKEFQIITNAHHLHINFQVIKYIIQNLKATNLGNNLILQQ